MKHDVITTHRKLEEFCELLRVSKWIAFDTEFVSEFTYYPELCLIQVAADHPHGELLAVIDTKAIQDVQPFWTRLVEGSHETICHAGREEFRFCARATKSYPKNWFDVQLAAGLVGLEYPASYGKLVSRLLQQRLPKGETRSDWRRRPLTDAQIEYALQDVVHLRQVADQLADMLCGRQRLAWMQQETDAWMVKLEEYETQEKWRRLSGLSGMSQDVQRIARALWNWREGIAQSKDTPPRRILRDDLLVELARRGRSKPQEILTIRGMEYRGVRGYVDEIGACIERAAADRSVMPKTARLPLPPQSEMLEKFLGTALNMICRQNSIAPGIVGTTQDLRELLSYELGLSNGADPPSLACGWRAELVGTRISNLLKGNASLRIVDPMSDAPIAVQPV